MAPEDLWIWCWRECLLRLCMLYPNNSQLKAEPRAQCDVTQLCRVTRILNETSLSRSRLISISFRIMQLTPRRGELLRVLTLYSHPCQGRYGVDPWSGLSGQISDSDANNWQGRALVHPRRGGLLISTRNTAFTWFLSLR